MKTCPKCGAENRQTATECRLCATPLESSEDLLVARMETGFESEISPSVVVSGGQSAGPGYAGLSSSEDLICPSCQGANDPDWLFCQQCGSKLVKPEPGHVAQHAESAEPVETRPAPTPSEPAGSTPQQAINAQFQSRVSRLSVPAFLTSPERPTPVPLDAEAAGQVQAGSQAAPNGPGPSAGPAKAAESAPKAGALPHGQGPAQQSVLPASEPGPATVEPNVPAAPGVCCINCGEHLVVGAMFCASCGVKISGPGTGPTPRSIGMAVIEMITDGGQVGDTYAVPSGGIHIGRVEGEITFPHDGYMSGRHAQITERDGEYYLTDQNSRNGTFIRIRGEVELKPGDTFLVGKQVFRFGRK